MGINLNMRTEFENNKREIICCFFFIMGLGSGFRKITLLSISILRQGKKINETCTFFTNCLYLWVHLQRTNVCVGGGVSIDANSV